jgi:hypothetical protein
MIVILRQLFDPLADELAQLLGPAARSSAIEHWFTGCRLEHRVGAAGVDTRIDAGGTPLVDADAGIVLNRIRRVSVAGYHGAAPPDAADALAEATAVLWSCLAGLRCPVLNSAPALGLVGRGSHPLREADLAHRCGLRARDYHLTTRSRRGDADGMRALDTPFAAGPGAPAWYGSATTGEAAHLWVVGDAVVGTLDGVADDAVLRFARALGLGFGVLAFERDGAGRWVWMSADPAPLYAPPHVVARLADYLAAHAVLACEVPS